MNRHLTFILGLAIVMMSALAGCAAVPMQEMSDARQALQAARAAEAGTHAAQRFGDAEQRLSRAERELANHYYTRARKDAVAARTAAISARNMALAIGQAKAAVAAAEREGAAAQGARELLAQAQAAAARLDEDEAVQAATHARAHFRGLRRFSSWARPPCLRQRRVALLRLGRVAAGGLAVSASHILALCR